MLPLLYVLLPKYESRMVEEALRFKVLREGMLTTRKILFKISIRLLVSDIYKKRALHIWILGHRF